MREIPGKPGWRVKEDSDRLVYEGDEVVAYTLACAGTDAAYIEEFDVLATGDGESAIFHTRDFLGVARVLLAGEPFGFTHFDVGKLHSLAFTVEAEDGAPLTAGWLRDLADRIAALLPPRDGGLTPTEEPNKLE